MTKSQVLVVHGALGSAAQMEPVARALEAVGAVTSVELKGHGRTAANDDEFGMQPFVEQLRAEVAKVAQSGGSAPVVFGYSMGGYVALALESQHPGTFAGIVTLGTKFAWTPALALRERGRLDATVIAEKIPKFAMTLAERHSLAGGWERVLDRTAKLLAELGNQPLLTRETLANVRARVCVAVGENDDTVNLDEAREFAAFIPNGTAAVVADAPHPIERVSVDAIAKLVREIAKPS